ncbi:hypothetical protein ACHAXT_003235 [Thalassiosira profunda]
MVDTSPSIPATAAAEIIDGEEGGDASVDGPPSDAAPLSLPPLTEDEYDPADIVSRIQLAAKWNQGRDRGQHHSNLRGRGKRGLHHRKHEARKWDYEFVRGTLDDYERHLRYVLAHLKARREADGDPSSCSSDLLSDVHSSPKKCTATHTLLSPATLACAARALTRSKMDTPALSQRIRDIERLVGAIGWTPITEELSYRLLEVNGKAGNVRRTLALLELRRRRGYPPRQQWVWKGKELTGDDADGANSTSDGSEGVFHRGEKEFVHAITSIQAAQLTLRRSRNIYLHESAFDETALDNPTRYLDAILLNMSQRGVPLRPLMASRMLACYASSGRTGRAQHYFYKVVRDPVEDDGYYIPGPHPTNLTQPELEEWKQEQRRLGKGRFVFSDEKGGKAAGDNDSDEDEEEVISGEKGSIITKTADEPDEKVKVRMIMHPPPPFHKIPSAVGEKSFSLEGPHISTSASPAPWSQDSFDCRPRTTKTKYEWELEREWSLSLTAAFAFADSLTHGACGHDPIELDVAGWTCMIKACCYRGAFHRALRILNETMPQRGIEPNEYSYNAVLAGLARVGDVAYLQELLMKMTNKKVPVNKYTVQAMADGLLNVGDIAGASTMVQDIFNQHDMLPPYTTHLKIIEFALGNGLIYEAKRHVYFVQQLWKWTPSQHHGEEIVQLVGRTKRNPKLSRKALQKLFRHFHEELEEKDFF